MGMTQNMLTDRPTQRCKTQQNKKQDRVPWGSPGEYGLGCSSGRFQPAWASLTWELAEPLPSGNQPQTAIIPGFHPPGPQQLSHSLGRAPRVGRRDV
jgi:hypothetical protein